MAGAERAPEDGVAVAAAAPQISPGVERVLKRLQESVAQGHYYEAQQQCRTICNRYQKVGKVEEQVQLLSATTCTLLQHHQHRSALDLALFLVDTIASHPERFALPEVLSLVKTVEGAFRRSFPSAEEAPQELEDVRQSDISYMMAVLRMVQQQRKQAAADSTRLAAGDELEKAVQDVHRILADIYMHPPAQPVLAVEHFARAGVPQAHAEAVVDYVGATGSYLAADIEITRAVVAHLAAASVASALTFLREAKKCLKGKKDIVLWGGTDVEASPLLHFCSYLCLSIERRSRALADFLVGKYQPALARDPSLAVAIEHCLAERVPSPRQADGLGDLLGGLMSSLLQA